MYKMAPSIYIGLRPLRSCQHRSESGLNEHLTRATHGITVKATERSRPHSSCGRWAGKAHSERTRQASEAVPQADCGAWKCAIMLAARTLEMLCCAS